MSSFFSVIFRKASVQRHMPNEIRSSPKEEILELPSHPQNSLQTHLLGLHKTKHLKPIILVIISFISLPTE